jgi:sulfate adenylyltransferase subunit 1
VPLLPQTRRHSLLAHLLRVPSIVFAVNKIDAVAEPGRPCRGQPRLQAFAAEAGICVAGIVPVSRCAATTSPCRCAPLVPGPQPAAVARKACPRRRSAPTARCLQPVQYVARDRRRQWAGPAARAVGPHRPRQRAAGDAVQVFPSGERAVVAAVRRAGHGAAAQAGSRPASCWTGSSTSPAATGWPPRQPAAHAAASPATLAWLDTEAAVAGPQVLGAPRQPLGAGALAPSTTGWTSTPAAHRSPRPWPSTRSAVVFELQQPLPVEPYASNRVGGALIVVDPASNRTSGALLVRSAGEA